MPKKSASDPLTAQINNFPDWLSPMLVKELRQGLRSRGFVIALIGGQLLLFMIILNSIASGSPQAAGQSIFGSLIWILCMISLIVQPLRGLGSIASDIKSKTLELMQLTRMNSTKIVFDKWLSLFTQTLLFTITLVPYFVLRYFFGGMDIGETLLILFTVLAVSGLFTAVCVGMSANKSTLIRGLVPFIGIPFLLFGSGSLFVGSLTGSPVSSGPLFFNSWAVFGIALTSLLYLSYLFIEMGASIIAPAAENRQTRMRLISLAFILFCCLVQFIEGEPLPTPFAAILISGSGLLFLSSYNFVAPRTARRFLKAGPLGKLSSRLLYPGWPAGTWFFSLCCLIILSAVLLPRVGLFEPEELVIATGFIGTFSLAGLLVQLIVPKTANRFAFLMIMLIIQGFVLFLTVILHESDLTMKSDIFLYISSLFPLSHSYSIEKLNQASAGYFLSLINGLYFALNFVMATLNMKHYRQVESSLQAPPADPAES